MCRKNDVEILRGVPAKAYAYKFIPLPPKRAISDLVQRMKGRTPHKLQRVFPALRWRYWGREFREADPQVLYTQ